MRTEDRCARSRARARWGGGLKISMRVSGDDVYALGVEVPLAATPFTGWAERSLPAELRPWPSAELKWI